MNDIATSITNWQIDLPLLAAFAWFAWVGSVTPGPNCALALATGANFGARAIGPHMLGVTIGFSTMLLVALMTAVAFNMATVCDEQQKRTLRDLAARDGLTGLLNRKGFLHLAEDALARHPGGGQLILADLDHFKQINDQHGHGAGDKAIVTFAAVCQSLVRATDLVGGFQAWTALSAEPIP